MITRLPRLSVLLVLAALVAAVAVAPQAQAQATIVTTWQQLRNALAAGGTVTVGADISGAGVTVSTSTSTTLDLAGHQVELEGGPAVELVHPARLTVTDSVGEGVLTASGLVGEGRDAAVIGTPGSRGGSTIAGALIIDDAVVRAHAPEQLDLHWGAIVGGGLNDHGGEVTLLGGELYADASSNIYGAAIGGGDTGSGGTVVVYDGTIEAYGSRHAAAIGGGAHGDAGHFTIHSGSVTAVSDPGGAGAGIGGGGYGNGGEVVVAGGRVIAVGSFGAGVGAGSGGEMGPQVYFSGGSLRAESVLGSPIGVDRDGRTGTLGGIHLAGPLSPDSVTDAPPGLAPIHEGATSPVTRIMSSWTGEAWSTVLQSTLHVEFDMNGGNGDIAPVAVGYGDPVRQPSAPTRPGHKFAGWRHGGSAYDFDSPVVADMTLTAQWSAVATPPPPTPVSPIALVDVSSDPRSPHYTPFHREIAWLASTGITKGWNVGAGKYEFRPKDEITREAMAAFMYRYAGSPAVSLPARSPFADVTPQSTNFYKEIIWMNQQGISTGWSVGGGTKEFRPKDAITRDAMAAFMYRFAGRPSATPPATSPFTDVPRTSQFYREITWLSSAGISTGWRLGNGRSEYRPYNNISREAMAAFLFRFDRA